MRDVRYLGIDDVGNRLHKCPACNEEIKVGRDVFYGQCSACGLTLIDYKPAPHQIAFHESSAMYKLNLGGYGTGKTTMSVVELAKHAMSVENGMSLITGPKLQQIVDAPVKELLKVIPPWFFAKPPTMKPVPRITLTNGHTIVVYASNDADSLRSLNLTSFYIEEASEVSYDVFQELQARTRNLAAIKRDAQGNEIENNLMGIIASNPEHCWIVDKFLLFSSKIYASPSVDVDDIKALNYEKKKDYHSFLSATIDNKYLPNGWVDTITAGKPPEWIDRMIYCKLGAKEGLVYPMFTKALVDDFPIPKNWKRVVGLDPGFADPFAVIFGAIDPISKVVYFYDEYYVRERSIVFHAGELVDKLKELDLFYPIKADPAILKRSDRDGRSLQDLWMSYTGIYLDTADNSIESGIAHVQTYMDAGKIKFFKSLVNIKGEMLKYNYTKGKPNPNVDEHLCDALRYITMEFPSDPNEFAAIEFTPGSKRLDLLGNSDIMDEMEESGIYYTK